MFKHFSFILHRKHKEELHFKNTITLSSIFNKAVTFTGDLYFLLWLLAEHQRIDAFELWCWRRLLRVPWYARRSNQSILRDISPGCSLEGLMLKLKLQCFGHLMRRVDSLENTLMLTQWTWLSNWTELNWTWKISIVV